MPERIKPGKSPGISAGFFDHTHSFRVLDLETLREREICRLREKHIQLPRHNTTFSPDNRFAITARALERKRKLGYQFAPHAVRSALIVIQLDDGKTRYLIQNTSPMGHKLILERFCGRGFCTDAHRFLQTCNRALE
ncbi:hypothetical protein MYX65_10900 [Acidobacteria bacterium AH-259-L09]|nr:hypothetical protein [Acidobacteria bacterium AH-259-L09]